MTPTKAIAIVFVAAVGLLLFCAVLFNREMAATSPMAEKFSAKVESVGVNAAVDTIRARFKAGLGLVDG